jgi:hypothetical protein
MMMLNDRVDFTDDCDDGLDGCSHLGALSTTWGNLKGPGVLAE